MIKYVMVSVSVCADATYLVKSAVSFHTSPKCQGVWCSEPECLKYNDNLHNRNKNTKYL